MSRTKYFSGGGTTYRSPPPSTITRRQCANAAPMAVYQYGAARNLHLHDSGPDRWSQYTVLLHFAETYFTAAGNREFNVAINGTTVLTNFDIYATAGSQTPPWSRQFTATANSSGDIVIAFTDGAANQPMFEGIEVLAVQPGAAAQFPPRPTGLTATASSSSAIGLSWSAVTPPANCTISSYSVYGSNDQRLHSVLEQPDRKRLTGTTYSNTGLAASTTYYYVVEAVDADGTSAASTQAARRLRPHPAPTVPSAPTGLTATASSSSAIGLSWTAVTPPANCSISSYSVYGSTTADSPVVEQPDRQRTYRNHLL